MEKYYYGYEEFVDDASALVHKIADFDPDTLLAVARGGLTLGHFMAQGMDTRRLFALNSIHYDKTQKLDTLEVFNIPDLSTAKRVLIVMILSTVVRHLERCCVCSKSNTHTASLNWQQSSINPPLSLRRTIHSKRHMTGLISFGK